MEITKITNLDLKKKWVAALRSGTYDQITCALKENGAYCCLGVLCEIVGHIPPAEEAFGMDENLPDEVAKMLGPDMPRDPAVKLPDGRVKVLSSLNDDLYWTFEQIADIIDQQL